MAGKGSGSEKHQQEELMWLAAVGLGALCVWLIWTYKRDWIIWISFGLDLPQMWIVDKIFDFNATFKGYIEFTKGVYRSPSNPSYINPFSVTFYEMTRISEIAGHFFKWVFSGIIFLFAGITALKMKGGGFSRSFSLGGKGGPSLAQYQSMHWKVFSTGSQFDPDDDSKLEAPAATPMEWMRDNNISLSKGTDGVDLDAAEDAFSRHLGDIWPGVEKAPIHIKALCTALYLNAKRDKKARAIKEQIAVAYSSSMKPAEREKTLVSLYEATKKDPKFLELIEKYASNHAYTNTAMFRLLTWSRKNGGVFASAEFRWLKPVDRTLWYVLNNCGRRAYHTEGAGAISHFNAEYIGRTPLVEPHVEQAVDGLDDYLKHQGIFDLEDFFNGQKNDFG